MEGDYWPQEQQEQEWEYEEQGDQMQEEPEPLVEMHQNVPEALEEQPDDLYHAGVEGAKHAIAVPDEQEDGYIRQQLGVEQEQEQKVLHDHHGVLANEECYWPAIEEMEQEQGGLCHHHTHGVQVFVEVEEEVVKLTAEPDEQEGGCIQMQGLEQVQGQVQQKDHH